MPVRIDEVVSEVGPSAEQSATEAPTVAGAAPSRDVLDVRGMAEQLNRIREREQRVRAD